MIKSVFVQNYRGIKSCRLDNLKKVNVFIGRNNSGKSSLLESLYLASAAFYFEEKFSTKVSNKINYLLNRRCYRGFNWDNARDTLWYEYDTGSPICIKINLDSEVIQVDLFDWHIHPLLRESFEDYDHLCIIEKKFAKSKKRVTEHAPPSTFEEGIGKIAKNFEKINMFFSNFMFIDTSLVQQMDIVEKKLWNELLKKRHDKLVVEVLREGYEVDVDDLTYTTYDGKTYQLAVKLPNTTLRVDDLGDGARYAVLLTMIAALSKDTVLLIEEPENHQHPSGLAKTLDMFLKLVKQNNVQVFITTHSLELLRLLKNISEEKRIDVGIYFFERDERGQVSARELTGENIDVLERMGFDPRFLDLI